MSARCYLVKDVLDKLAMSQTTFTTLKRQGKLPFVEELLPRAGGKARYRAAPLDRYLDGQWGRPVSFSSHRRVG